MNLKNIIVASLTALSLIAAPAAMAADLTSPAINPVYVSQTVNFDGPYAGIGVITTDAKDFTPVVSVGYDVRYDSFIVGGEVFATVNATPVLGVDVKAGVVITDNLAVYGLAGVQRDFDTNVNSHSFGIGADLALTENVYLTGSYKQIYDFGTSTKTDDQFRVGVKIPF